MDTHERPATSRRHARFVATVLAALPLAAQAPPAPPKAAPDPTVGLPTFLLPVPGGLVTMGLTIEEAIAIASQSVSPDRPELALKLKEKLFLKALGNIASELGQERRNVDTFLLGKWPVTNREYEIYLKQMAAIGVKVKPPFHWWRIGRKDDYDAKLQAINDEFKADGKWGPLKFWERYGLDLPYALKDDKGQSIDKRPVVNVTYRDAVRYAGWLGMRMPTELERTRAARGDTQRLWPLGFEHVGDKYTAAVLGHMQLAKAADQSLKDVGSVAFLNGPFGHFDMTGQVWEFTSVRGFDPLCGPKAFELEWKRAQQDKVGALLVNSPAWKDKQYVVIKGSSYFSSQDPIQFHIDCRDKVMTDDVLDAVGFRLAKSLKPGYDLLVSLVSSDYNMELFESGKEDQGVGFASQIGLERYVLDAEGFPLEYHALSIAPVTWLSAEKNPTVPKLEERSHHTPVLLGTMATTEPMLQPKLGPGIYSVAYRQKGMPKELKDAIKAGYKEVQAALKKGADAGATPPAAPEAEGEGQKGKKADWRAVLARFGLTEKDLEPKNADDLEFVRLGTYQVPTDQDLILFFDNQGKWVGHVAGSLSAGNLAPNELMLGTGKVDKVDHLKVELKMRVSLLKDQKKGAEYKFEILFEQAPPAAGVTWRMPVENGNGAAGGGNNRIVDPPKPVDPPKSVDVPKPVDPKKPK